MTIEVVEQQGWEVVRLRCGRTEVDVLPAKGGDLLAVRWIPKDVNVLWTTPWGLRLKGAVPSGGDPTAHWLENYPGGWQTIFPNGGDPALIGGVRQGFHGEASLVPWACELIADSEAATTIRLRTRLSRSPFALTRLVSVSDAGVDVEETVVNVGGVPLDVMWSHHPAFGAPFVSGDCTIETAAAWFEWDDERIGPHHEMPPGTRVAWPGDAVDLRRMPAPGAGVERFGYLGGFTRGWAAITNPVMGLAVELSWDAEVMPHAWLWLEANGTPSFPWYRSAYVVAIEPATSYPGQGAEMAAAKTGTLVSFGPGEERSVHVGLRLTDATAR